MIKQKIVENYFDAKKYTNQEIMQLIEENKKEYAKKIIDIDINLNEFGVYVVTYYFKVRDNIFQKIFIKLKQKRRRNKIELLQENTAENIKMTKKERANEEIRKRMEKYSGNVYGVYKKTKTYKPY